jgi:sugar phosphate isomerase/epimerase
MELGISTLGHVIDIALSNKFENLLELQLKASREGLNFAEENGIKIVELVIDTPEVFKNENLQKFVDIINSYSLKKQIHGPYIDLNLCSHNIRIMEASIESYLETLKLCKEIDAKIMTIHPGLANYMISSIRELNKNQLKGAINKLLNYKYNKNINICLENMPKNAYIMTDYKNIVEVFNTIDRSDLYLTYDTSHYYTCNGNVQKLWATFYRIIRNVHVVDNFSKNSDTHPPLGNGKINFKEIFKIITSYDYKGPIIIELSSAKSLNQSINFITKFL